MLLLGLDLTYERQDPYHEHKRLDLAHEGMDLRFALDLHHLDLELLLYGCTAYGCTAYGCTCPCLWVNNGCWVYLFLIGCTRPCLYSSYPYFCCPCSWYYNINASTTSGRTGRDRQESKQSRLRLSLSSRQRIPYPVCL